MNAECRFYLLSNKCWTLRGEHGDNKTHRLIIRLSFTREMVYRNWPIIVCKCVIHRGHADVLHWNQWKDCVHWGVKIGFDQYQVWRLCKGRNQNPKTDGCRTFFFAREQKGNNWMAHGIKDVRIACSLHSLAPPLGGMLTCFTLSWKCNRIESQGLVLIFVEKGRMWDTKFNSLS